MKTLTQFLVLALMGSSSAMADERSILLRDKAKALNHAMEDLIGDFSNFTEDYNDKFAFSGAREFNLFQRNIDRFRRSHFEGPRTPSALAGDLVELALSCRGGEGNFENECVNERAIVRCDSTCEYPGKTLCQVIDCRGQEVRSYEEKCEVELEKISCSKCGNYEAYYDNRLRNDFYRMTYHFNYGINRVETITVTATNKEIYGTQLSEKMAVKCEEVRSQDVRCNGSM